MSDAKKGFLAFYFKSNLLIKILLGLVLGAIFGKGLLSSGNIGKVATSARSANSVLKERSDVKLSEQEVAQLNAQIEELMAKFEEDASALKAKNDVQNVEVTEVEVGPKSSDIYDEKLYLLWK